MKIAIIILTGLMIFCFSCKKSPNQNLNDCIDIPPSSSPFGYVLKNREIVYKFASFNPLDASQIVYIKVIDSNINLVACIRDLKTGKETELKNQAFFPPRWSKNNWILLNQSDDQIWKLAINGDSLTQITTKHSNFYPDLSPDSKKNAVITDYNDKNQWPCVYDIHSGTYSVINKVDARRITWSPDGSKIAYQVTSNEKNSILISDTGTFNTIEVASLPKDNFAEGGICWSPDSKYLIWVADKGLYKTDVPNKTTTQLRLNCNSCIYMGPSVSPDGNNIMFTKLKATLIAKNTQYSYSDICIMDFNGNNEHQLF